MYLISYYCFIQVRGTTKYHLSPMEQRAFAGAISSGVPNTLWRIRYIQGSKHIVENQVYLGFQTHCKGSGISRVPNTLWRIRYIQGSKHIVENQVYLGFQTHCQRIRYIQGSKHIVENQVYLGFQTHYGELGISRVPNTFFTFPLEPSLFLIQ